MQQRISARGLRAVSKAVPSWLVRRQQRMQCTFRIVEPMHVSDDMAVRITRHTQAMERSCLPVETRRCVAGRVRTGSAHENSAPAWAVFCATLVVFCNRHHHVFVISERYCGCLRVQDGVSRTVRPADIWLNFADDYTAAGKAAWQLLADGKSAPLWSSFGGCRMGYSRARDARLNPLYRACAQGRCTASCECSMASALTGATTMCLRLPALLHRMNSMRLRVVSRAAHAGQCRGAR